MDPRVQIVAIIASSALFLIVLELVRRRRFLERYALLWLFSAACLVALSAWRGLLENVSSVIGIAYAPSALFVIAFGFILVLLLHFSLAVSRLADQNKMLAQRVAMLQERQERLERGLDADDEEPAPLHMEEEQAGPLFRR